MHKFLAIMFVAGILTLVGCVAQRHKLPSSENRPQSFVITNEPPEFRQYDEAFMNKIQKRWYGLIDSLPSSKSWTGKIVVTL